MLIDQATMTKIAEVSDSSKRYDIVFFLDIHDGNPNGDPDSNNRPRLDEETGHGLISDVCIKRKVRDYVDLVHGDEPRNAIYVLNRNGFLEEVNTTLVKECEADKAFLGGYKEPFQKKGKSLKPEVIANFACNKWFDWRCFGAVPGKPVEKSTVRGPVQLQFGTSIDPISLREHTISRVVQNKPSTEKNSDESHGTFGTKFTVGYAAYRFAAHFSAFLAKQTGFNDEDMKLFWEALVNWPGIDSSAARPSMSVQGLYVFKHDSVFGNAQAHKLLDMVKLSPLGSNDAKSWQDYESQLVLPEEGKVLPGVTFHRLVG